MEHITLNNGVELPMVGYGTWNVRGKEGERSLLTALEAGYRLIDTAQMYENEREVGRALRASGLPREELFITTKLHRPNRGYAQAKAGIERSLNELQVEYIDLLLVHEPYREAAAMYDAMKEAYQAGKLRAIGVSNFGSALFRQFVTDCGVVPAVDQVESHVYYPQLDLQRELRAHGVAMQAWGPFTEGRRDIFAEPLLQRIGRAHGKSAAQIALKYLVQNGVAVIPKSSHAARMRENIDLFDFTLSDEEMAQLHSLNGGDSLFHWYSDHWL